MSKKIKIGRIFTIVVLVLSLVPIIILSVLSGVSTSKSIHADYKKNGEMILNISKGIIDSDIKGYVNDLNDVIKNCSFNDLDKLKESLVLLDDKDESILNFYYAEEKTGYFLQSLDHEMLEGYDAKSRPWYKESISNKDKEIVHNPYIDPATGKNVITISKAVVKDGQVIGVLAIDVELTVLSNRLSEIKYGVTGQVMISAEDGFVVSNTDVSKIGTQEPTEYSVWNDIMKNDNGKIEFEYDSKKYEGYYQTSEFTGWKVILKTEKSELMQSQLNILKTSLIVIAIILAVVVALTIYAGNKISHSVNSITEGLLRAANGDFRGEIVIDSMIKEFNILGESFANMKDKLGILIGKVNESVSNVSVTTNNSINVSKDISSSIEQVSNTMSEISEGTTKSADGLENIASDMERLSQSIVDMKNEADNANNTANKTNNLGKKGLEIADLVMNKSHHTKNSISEVDKVVSAVAKSIEKIDDINSSIAAITEQTNLLALNAAIEAARAGEAGKGFAVVADEIRKLAEETAVSAKEIDLIIKELNEKSKSVVERVKNTDEVVIEQENAVLESQQIFRDIVVSVENLSDEVIKIADGITSINLMKESVVDKVGDLSALLEETAAGSEEVTASAEEISASTESFVEDLSGLKEKSDDLNKRISEFKF